MTILFFLLGLALFVVGIFLTLAGEKVLIIIGVILAIIGLCLVIYSSVLAAEESKDACEGIGGKYVVVDREYNVSLKQTVNVYLIEK